MDRANEGPVHKIVIGVDPLGGDGTRSMVFKVGQKLKSQNIGAGLKPQDISITQIVHDHNSLVQFGVDRYLIYAEREGHPEFLYRTFKNTNIHVIYTTPVLDTDKI